jgi:dCTP deaminase
MKGEKRMLHLITDIFSPVLSDRTIRRLNRKGLLLRERVPDVQVQPNSVDLTLADTYSKLKTNSRVPGTVLTCVDPKLPIEYDKDFFPFHGDSQFYILEPKEFVLMATREYLVIPNGIMAFAQGRSSIARLSIQTEAAGLIDAGFEGTITLEIYNQSEHKILLYPGMRIAHVHFQRAQRAKVPYSSERSSKYSTQVTATGSRIHLDEELR